MTRPPTVDTIAPIVELLMECSSSGERNRLILETALATHAVQAAELWRRVQLDGVWSWQSILSRGPADLLPSTAEVEACADEQLPGGPAGRKAVALAQFGSEARALGLGDVASQGEGEEWVELLEALLWAATIIEVSEAELGIDASLIGSLSAPLPASPRRPQRKPKASERTEDTAPSVGNTPKGLQHDLRNLLTSIRLTEGICNEMGDPEGRFSAILAREYSRAGDLLSEALAPGRSRAQSCMPAKILHERIESHRSALPTDFDIVFELLVAPEVKGYAWPMDPAHLGRAVDNLLVNAREALGAQGGRIQARLEVEDNGGTVLTVEDDGPGLPPGSGTTLFEAGISHGKHAHAGLGLAMIREWVENAGGWIRAGSSPIGGASFRIGMPPGAPN